MDRAAIQRAAEAIVCYDAAGAHERVTFPPRLGVGVTVGLRDAADVAGMLRDLVVEAVLPLFAAVSAQPRPRTEAVAARLVRVEPPTGALRTVLLGGLPLVGPEEPYAAEARAMAMRAAIIGAVEEALDEQPLTQRRTGPPSAPVESCSRPRAGEG